MPPLSICRWHNVLTEADRDRLLRFLPPGADDELTQVRVKTDLVRAIGRSCTLCRWSTVNAQHLFWRSRCF